jgi:uncharacterized damage-inducible protein DinB
MKRVFMALPVVALLAPVVYSQAPAQGGQKISLATSLQRGYAGFKTNFTAAAEKMPDADYSFKPGTTELTPPTRTYAQVISHIAQAQFGQCSALTGQTNPMQGKNLEQELKTKADVTKALADSFALCDKPFADVTDASALEMVRAGQNEQTRAASLYGVIVHGQEIAGTAYAYLRAKGLVPPNTERAMQGRGRGN